MQSSEGQIVNGMLPAFSHGNVPLFLSANNHYVPYLSTLLQSIMLHVSADKAYDIIVLHTDICPESQEVLLGQSLRFDNVSLRFFDISEHCASLTDVFVHSNFSIETYYRLFIPDLFPAYDKALYLDCDMIVLDDIADLFGIDIGDCLVGACRDADSAGLYNGFLLRKRSYIDNVLGLSNPYDYFQAGTLVCNLKEFRASYSAEEMIRYATQRDWELMDQDVLNRLAEGRVFFIDMAWNSMVDWGGVRIRDIISLAPDNLRDEYMRARRNPKIIHYAGPEKPWQNPKSDCADVFWEYAAQTPFSDVIKQRLKQNEHGHSYSAADENSRAQKMLERVLPLGSSRRLLFAKFYSKLHSGDKR